MNREFIEKIIEEVKAKIPEELRDILTVEVKEIIKDNDTRLHGVIIQAPEQNVTPTIYLEDMLKAMPEGAELSDMADNIIGTYLKGMMNAPRLEDISIDYEDIKDRLQIQIADAGRNRDRLKDLVYKPLDNGMVMLAYVVIREDNEGSYQFAITKDLARDKDYDMDRLFDRAMANTIAKNAPVMTDMRSMIMSMEEGSGINPLKEGFNVRKGEPMYVLTNSSSHLGAAVLYYPHVQQNIAEALKDNYYVLPSSKHEVIIIPESAGINLKAMQDMVKDANKSFVDDRDVLSDRVLKYDREKQRLTEPKPLERGGSDRGDR